MDQHSPDSYTEATAAESLQGAAEVVQHIRGLNSSRLLPALIPRFIPTCSQQLLECLGELAAQQNLRIHRCEAHAVRYLKDAFDYCSCNLGHANLLAAAAAGTGNLGCPARPAHTQVRGRLCNSCFMALAMCRYPNFCCRDRGNWLPSRRCTCTGGTRCVMVHQYSVSIYICH
jgi:hypothetical protein